MIAQKHKRGKQERKEKRNSYYKAKNQLDIRRLRSGLNLVKYNFSVSLKQAFQEDRDGWSFLNIAKFVCF
jgi:hypothetical protein